MMAELRKAALRLRLDEEIGPAVHALSTDDGLRLAELRCAVEQGQTYRDLLTDNEQDQRLQPILDRAVELAREQARADAENDRVKP
jgi:hypothetical protein